jgi:simple sugar transport system ATP-binding protein
MIGRTITVLDEVSKTRSDQQAGEHGKPVLQADGFGQSGEIAPMDLKLFPGEVLGLAGLVGSGRTETAGLLFGLSTPDSGTLTVNGKKVSKFSPHASIGRGIALSPEDRKAAGVVDELTVKENIILAMQSNRGWLKFLSPQKQEEIAEKYIKLLEIATPSPDQPVKNLSGGNQQKVILARWLAIDPQVLILDEPTRGIDVGTKAEIQKLVLKLAEEGKSCIFISSELEEVMRTSHRIAVFSDHKKVAEFGPDVDERKIMQTMAGSNS